MIAMNHVGISYISPRWLCNIKELSHGLRISRNNFSCGDLIYRCSRFVMRPWTTFFRNVFTFACSIVETMCFSFINNNDTPFRHFADISYFIKSMYNTIRVFRWIIYCVDRSSRSLESWLDFVITNPTLPVILFDLFGYRNWFIQGKARFL